MKRIALATAIVLATLMGAALAWRLRSAILLFLLSLAVAAAARPFVERLTRRRLPRLAGLVAVVVAGGAVVVVALIGVATLLLYDVQRLGDDLVAVYEHIAAAWPHGTAIEQTIARRLPSPEQAYAALTSSRGAAAWSAILGTAYTAFEGLVSAVVVLALSVYWSVDRVHFERLWLSVLPLKQRALGRELWRQVEAEVGAYVRSELVQSLAAGVLLGVGYWLVGFRYPALLAVVAAAAWLLPWVGWLVALLALGLCTFPMVVLEGHWPGGLPAALSALHTVVVFAILERYVEPRLFNRRRYISLLAAVAMIGLAESLGVMGLLLGPPLAVALQVVVEFFQQIKAAPTAVAATPAVEVNTDFSDMQQRLTQLHGRLEHAAEPRPELLSIVDRLSDLVGSARAWM